MEIQLIISSSVTRIRRNVFCFTLPHI